MNTYLALLVFLTVVAENFAKPTESLVCKDENGEDVDWYILYKLPKIKSKNSKHGDGFGYAYLTGDAINGKSNAKNKEWQVSSRKITDSDSMLNQTLALAYKNEKKISYVVYSDQPPEGKGNTYKAHAKGVLAMDANNGFWITHSIPRFPPALEGAKGPVYPDSGANYGQVAFCMSFKTDSSASQIIQHLTVAKPHIYASGIAKSVLKDDTDLRNLVENKRVKIEETSVTFKTLKGTSLTAFAKGKKPEVDLYSAVIAPTLGTTLLTETWRNGEGGKMGPACEKPNTVNNIEEVTLASKEDAGEIKWLSTQDHSKWAVSNNEKVPVTCLADVNRMESQTKRGGGAICMQDPAIWKAFRSSVTQMDKC